MWKTLLKFGLGIAALLIIMKLFELSYFMHDLSIEVYIAIVGAAFMAIGLLFGYKYQRRQVQPQIEKFTGHSPAPIPEGAELSRRELEILQKIAEGHSNQQIADMLFVSLNTVKTHTSNIYAKLDVSRRTQAIDKARKLKIIG